MKPRLILLLKFNVNIMSGTDSQPGCSAVGEGRTKLPRRVKKETNRFAFPDDEDEEKPILVDEWPKDCKQEQKPLEEGKSDDSAVTAAEEVKGEPCSVCLGSVREPTALDGCNHIFCFDCIRQWLKHSEAGLCPLCKVPTNGLVKNVGSSNASRVNMAALRKVFEAEIRLERGNAVPLTFEKEILSARMHVLRTHINKLEQQMSESDANSSRTTRTRLKKMYEDRVSDLTSLRVLVGQINDSSITRAELIGHPNFRRLIYVHHPEWYLVDPNANPNRRSFTTAVCRSDVDAHRARLVPWILRELGFVVKGEGRRTYLRSRRNREEVANTIFNTCINHQIHSPTFRSTMVALGISRGCVDQFQHELFEFASSNLSIEDHYSISGYRLSAPQPRPTGPERDANFAVGGLEDNGDSSNDIPLVTLNEDGSDDVIVLEGSIANGERQQGSNNESIYLPDDPVSSGSDVDAELYARRSCLLPGTSGTRQNRRRRQAPMEVQDRYGHSWNVGQRPAPIDNLFPYQSTCGVSSFSSYQPGWFNRFQPLLPRMLHRVRTDPRVLPRSNAPRTEVVLSSDDENEPSIFVEPTSARPHAPSPSPVNGTGEQGSTTVDDGPSTSGANSNFCLPSWLTGTVEDVNGNDPFANATQAHVRPSQNGNGGPNGRKILTFPCTPEDNSDNDKQAIEQGTMTDVISASTGTQFPPEDLMFSPNRGWISEGTVETGDENLSGSSIMQSPVFNIRKNGGFSANGSGDLAAANELPGSSSSQADQSCVSSADSVIGRNKDSHSRKPKTEKDRKRKSSSKSYERYMKKLKRRVKHASSPELDRMNDWVDEMKKKIADRLDRREGRSSRQSSSRMHLRKNEKESSSDLKRSKPAEERSRSPTESKRMRLES